MCHLVTLCYLFSQSLYSHSQFPGPLTEENIAVGRLLAAVTVAPSDAIQQAFAFHATFHQNTSPFCKQLHLILEQAQQIVKQYSSRVIHLPSLSMEVIPQ